MSIWLEGKYNSCRVYTDNIDNETISQLIELLNQKSVENNHIAIMPDCHAGRGCVIGTTMTLSDKVIPSLVGVDIGCGMLTVKLADSEIDFEKLDNVIRENIPHGFSIRDKALKTFGYESIIAPVDLDRAYKSLGTLGGGNHFIEIDKSNSGYWLVIHTGSRHLGVEICSHYQNLAYSRLQKQRKDFNNNYISTMIDSLRKNGREREIETEIKKAKNNFKDIFGVVPKELSYIEGEDYKNYLHDMALAQKFASHNRDYIAKIIIEKMNFDVSYAFGTIHNYIDMNHNKPILRKGSVSARKDELLIIPLNMRDGSLICKGKGNPFFNYSAPHGAGRTMSRACAKESIPLELYQESMEGIFSTCVNNNTIDESPFAYKPMEEIISNIGETVDIIEHIKPVYNFKSN